MLKLSSSLLPFEQTLLDQCLRLSCPLYHTTLSHHANAELYWVYVAVTVRLTYVKLFCTASLTATCIFFSVAEWLSFLDFSNKIFFLSPFPSLFCPFSFLLLILSVSPTLSPFFLSSHFHAHVCFPCLCSPRPFLGSVPPLQFSVAEEVTSLSDARS